MAKETFQIKGDSPVVDDLMFWRVVGHETLSRPSCYELTVLSKNQKIQAKDILGHAFDMVMEFDDKEGAAHKRHCQGHAIRFTRVGEVGRYYRYQIALQSWFGLLSKRTNSRILQDKPVLEILNAVFEDSPIKRVKKTKIHQMVGDHKAHRYCVQHQESDYKFLSRLLEEEGIYYWFDSHNEVGTMHISDASDVAHDKLAAIDTLKYVSSGSSDARFNEITRWVSSKQLETGKYASRDSDFKAIKKKLAADKGDPDTHELADLEAFEFAGDYFRNADTDGVAKMRLEELVSHRQRAWVQTGWPDVTAGKSFTFKGDPNEINDGDYLIASCTFVVSHPGYEGLAIKEEPRQISSVLQTALADDAVNADTRSALVDMLDNTPAMRTGILNSRAFLLTVLPLDMPYRVPRLTPRVVMPGPQSAIVVGPEGEEIHADDFGRVKVHFYWDRYDKSNEKSTCWVRVSQPWAGKGWGGYFIPRIGQEVIVDFLNGDPDRPIIVGRMYNDDQPKPFDSHTQSGFRTRSTPKGSAANCNEFRFDDKKGSEQVYLHAEKNQDISVENDETHTVGHDRTKTIDHDETNHIKHDRTETVDNNEKITIGVNRTEQVGSNETIAIGIDRKETVGANESITIGANRTIAIGASETASVLLQRTHTVGINETISVGAAQEITIGAKQVVTIGADQSVNVGADQSTDVGSNQSAKVGANRSIQVGSNLSTDVSADESRGVGGGRSTQVGKDDAINVGKNFTLQAGDSISLTTGSASITMKKDGTIVIKGKDITVDGSGKINVKASSDIVMKGSKIMQN
jgi:type VI secretion system secreted protein VgrG